MPQNFFTLLKDGSVERIVVNQELQQELTNLFGAQTAAFLTDDLEPVSFNGAFHPDEGEILTIPEFVLPAAITDAIEHPLNCDVLDLQNATSLVQSIFTGTTGRHPTASFQVFDGRRLLGKGFSIISTNNTFTKLTAPGLTLDTRLGAHHKGGTLYFRSYASAKRIFDLTPYYHEATDAEVQTFLSHPTLYCADEHKFTSAADTWIRKKVTLILASAILTSVPTKTIVAKAKRQGITLTTTTIDGKLLLVLPENKKELKTVLHFLDEDDYEGPLTRTRFISNSKHPVNVT